jgi:DNA polymerase/3'-5' exonuclease PolX
MEAVSRLNDNLRVAERLAEAAGLLRARGASVYSVRAYKRAGDSVAKTPRNVRRLYRSLGVMGLDALPNVGLGIASDIGEMLETGHWTLLDRLRSEADPETLRKVATRARRAAHATALADDPPVQLLLDIDAEG